MVFHIDATDFRYNSQNAKVPKLPMRQKLVKQPSPTVRSDSYSFQGLSHLWLSRLFPRPGQVRVGVDGDVVSRLRLARPRLGASGGSTQILGQRRPRCRSPPIHRLPRSIRTLDVPLREYPWVGGREEGR